MIFISTMPIFALFSIFAIEKEITLTPSRLSLLSNHRRTLKALCSLLSYVLCPFRARSQLFRSYVKMAASTRLSWRELSVQVSIEHSPKKAPEALGLRNPMFVILLSEKYIEKLMSQRRVQLVSCEWRWK